MNRKNTFLALAVLVLAGCGRPPTTEPVVLEPPARGVAPPKDGPPTLNIWCYKCTSYDKDWNPIEHPLTVGLVGAGSSAKRAGVQEDDVILKVGGVDIDMPRDFDNAVSRLRPGETVEVLVMRRGETMVFFVRVESAKRGW